MSAGPLQTLRVTAKRAAAKDVCELTLEPLPGMTLAPFEAGAHLELHLPGGLLRPYSLSNDPAERHRCVLGVLREPASRGGSLAVHDRLEVGQTLQASLPRCHFPLQATPAHKLLLAGGIGITPLLAMARQLAREGRSFELHYAARSNDRMAFTDVLTGSGPLAARTRLYAGDLGERIDLAGVISAQAAGSELYVCGPAGFMNAALQAAREQGWPESRLHRELFGAEPVTHSGGDRAFEIEIAGSGRIVNVPVGCTAAQALQSAGLPLLTSCEQGVCGTCLTRVVSGEPDHRDQYLTPEEQAANDQFLPCCSRARSMRLVIDLPV